MAEAQYCGRVGFSGSYVNATYGFSLKYEGGWNRLHVGASEDQFQMVCRDTVVIDASVLDFGYVDFPGASSYEDSVRIAATSKASLFCGADGPDGSTYCENPAKLESVSLNNSLPVIKFYQTFVREDFTEDEVVRTRREIGPYYAIDISRKGVRRFLLITSEMHRSASEKYAEAVEAVIGSVKLVEAVLPVR